MVQNRAPQVGVDKQRFFPHLGIDMARLAVVNDFPSLGPADVTTTVVQRGVGLTNEILVLSDRYDSVITESSPVKLRICRGYWTTDIVDSNSRTFYGWKCPLFYWCNVGMAPRMEMPRYRSTSSFDLWKCR